MLGERHSERDESPHIQQFRQLRSAFFCKNNAKHIQVRQKVTWFRLLTVSRWNAIRASGDFDKSRLLNSYTCSLFNAKGASHHLDDTCDIIVK